MDKKGKPEKIYRTSALLLAALLAVALLLSYCGKADPEEEAEAGEVTATDAAQTEEGELIEPTEPTEAAEAKLRATKVLQNGQTITGGDYYTEAADKSVFAMEKGHGASVTGASIRKASGDSTDGMATARTGINSAVRVTDGASLTLSGCEITTSAVGAPGVFAYSGGKVKITDTRITAEGGSSGGIHVGGGTVEGSGLTVTAYGAGGSVLGSIAGGSITLTGGKCASLGEGCPVIYGGGDVSLDGTECSASSSRAVTVDGQNTVTLNNCSVYGNDISEGTRANVLILQNSAEEKKEQTGVFTMTGGSLSADNGVMFCCTNTSGVINLSGVSLSLSPENTLLSVCASAWGVSGKNGGSCIVNAVHQKLNGRITVDGLSALSLMLSDSVFTGFVESAGTVTVNLDQTSSWVLTADSRVTALSGNTAGVVLNGHTLYVGDSVFGR